MIVTKMALPRRTVLRGLGATLALPLLDSMVPALSAMSRTAANPVRRLGFLYVPNGAEMENWTPVGEGADFEWSPILAPLEPFRDQTLVLSGLAHMQAMAFNDGAGDHRRDQQDGSDQLLSLLHGAGAQRHNHPHRHGQHSDLEREAVAAQRIQRARGGDRTLTPHWGTADFKSAASAGFATRAGCLNSVPPPGRGFAIRLACKVCSRVISTVWL